MPRRSGYQIPTVLQDLVLVDMLEITGSTVGASRILNISQPTVSRRYRALAADLGLRRLRTGKPGARFGDSPCLQLLRKGANLHRWQQGVLRIAAASSHRHWVNQQAIVEWLDLPPIDPEHWSCLLRRELLDGLLLPANEQELLGTYGTRVLIHFPNQPTMVLICRPHPLVRNLVNTWFRS
jgi:hypothetical protein